VGPGFGYYGHVKHLEVGAVERFYVDRHIIIQIGCVQRGYELAIPKFLEGGRAMYKTYSAASFLWGNASIITDNG
jgi:hypothetical protein